MGTRAWLNVALLGGVAVLAVVWLLSPGIDEPQQASLTDVDITALAELRIEAPGQSPVELRRVGAVWHLAEPVASVADEQQVARVMALFTTPSAQHYPLAGRDLASFGLDAPNARLRGGGVELAFGKLDPLNYRRYVRTGDTLHLIQYADISMLTAGWPLFVDTRLVASGQNIVALSVPGVGALRRTAEGWQIAGAESFTADEMAALVEAWREVRAVAVERLSETQGSRFVVIEYAGEAVPLRLSVISDEDGLVLGQPDLGVEYHFTAAQAGRLLGRGEVAEDDGHGHGHAVPH